MPKNSEGKYANVAFKVSNTMTENGSVKRGVLFQDKNGNLDRLVESKIEGINSKIIAAPLDGSKEFEVSEDTLVSMNLFAFSKDLIQKLVDMFPLWLKENINVPKSEFLIPTVVDELVNKGEATMKILNTDSVWFGVTYKEDKPGVVKALKELVNKGVYKEGLY